LRIDPMLNLVLALLAGVVTVAAPCTLPMLPILLGASVGQTSRVRPALIALGFVMSFSAVALLLGFVTRRIDFDPNVLRTAGIALLFGFGLLMISGSFRMAVGPDRWIIERCRRARCWARS
jgi:cytochrome c-type biogenesis protein